jgi:hypothetical protein
MSERRRSPHVCVRCTVCEEVEVVEVKVDVLILVKDTNRSEQVLPLALDKEASIKHEMSFFILYSK